MKSNPTKLPLFVVMILLVQLCVVTVVAQTQSQSLNASSTTVTAKSTSATEEAQKTELSNGSPTETRAAVVNETATPRASTPDNRDETAGTSAVTPVPQGGTTDKWQFQFSPYLWIAGVNGTAGIGNLTVDVKSGITDPNVHLNFGFMGTFEARKNKLFLLTDLQYSNLGTERPTPGPLFSSASADFKTFILDPEVGYRVAENPEKGRFVDLLAGIRYWHLRTDLNFAAGLLPARSATASRGWVDGVIGIRGRIHLSPRVFLVGKADLGGGGSRGSFQLFGGGGFQVSKRIALLGGYRDLFVDYHKNDFLFDMSLNGPIFGMGIKF